MSIIDRIFVGRVIKDFGPIEQKSLGIGRLTKSVLLTEKRGKLHFILKFSAWLFPLSASVSYEDFTLEDAYKMRDFINESEQLARNLPPSSYDPKKEAFRNALIIAVVGAVITALLRDSTLALVATAIMLALYTKQYWDFRNSPEIDLQTKLRLALFAGLAILIGGVKVALLIWGKQSGA